MRKIFTFWLPILLMAGAVGSAWGQEYVTGDKYERKTINLNSEAEITADKFGVTKDGVTHNIESAFDNNENTWWEASSNGTVTVTINFGETVSLGGLSALRSGNAAQRAKKIEFYTSENGTNGSWGEAVYTKENIPKGTDEASHNYSDRYTFTFPTITTQYLQMKITPHGDYEAASAFNEVYFLPAVEHKAAMWYNERGESTNETTGDTFDRVNDMFHSAMMEGTTEIQASHTYIDTIYVHKGSKTRLTLPTIQSSEALSSVAAYQRWYSYRTDGTFAVHVPRTNNSEVYDLLTPVESYTTTTTSSGTQTINPTAHRFANGYIGNPEAKANESFLYTNSLVEMDFYYPTDTEFESWFPDAQDSKFDNNWYIVACDVSCYTDYKDWEKEEIAAYCEPTLSHRVLFYIVGVDDRDSETGTNFTNWYAKLKEPSYQGATSMDYKSKNFLEEYDITFPYTRVSTNTLDMVALTKDARGYAIPDAENDTEVLILTLVDESDTEASGITFENNTTSSIISGENRVIHFKYPKTLDDGSQQVSNKNAKATILVTKTVGSTIYNLVRYNLTFVPETQLLTETQIEKIDEGTAGNVYWNIPERTPKNLQEYTLVTSMTWDYKEAEEKQEGYYPFPMDWSYSSYAFYDGSSKNNSNHHFYGQKDLPQWGYYAIMKGYMSWDTPAHSSENEYHLYVDASDRPGTIARLPFRRSLCAGSELLVSAMVKSANPTKSTPDKRSDDAGMLFTIFRVQEDTEGNTISSTPIYRHATGQIMHTSQLSEGVPHNGNEWYQVYFSFTNGDFGNEDLNPDDNIQYSYVLQIDNYSASTDGGDMYLDNVQVFVRPMTAEVTQDEPTCDDRPIVNMRLNWDQLYSRIKGMQGTGENESAIDFCIIDVAEYKKAIADNSNIADAITAAAVQIGEGVTEEDDGSTSGYDAQYGSLWYKWDFNANTKYDSDENGNKVLAIDNQQDGKYYFYRETENGINYLSVDIHAELTPGKQYQMLLVDHNGETVTLGDFTSSITDEECGMRTEEFTVEGVHQIKINGSILNAEDIQETYCIGQTFNFTIQLRVEGEDGMENYDNPDIYYDWFFGDMTDYTTNIRELDGLTDLENKDSYSFSVQDALEAFRSVEAYRDAETISENTPVSGSFTDEHRAVLLYYSTHLRPNGGRNPILVLHQQSRMIRILEQGLQLVVQPINIYRDRTDDEGVQLREAICWNAIPLNLSANGSSPTLYPGFGDVNYPNVLNPNLRIGLAQIKAAVESTTSEISVEIPLRDVAFAFGNESNATHLGLRKALNEDGTVSDNKFENALYLQGSNDPALKEILENPDFDNHFYTIGRIVKLYANKDADASNDVMRIRFNLSEQTLTDGTTTFTFNPREGYYYTFGFHFQEYGEENDSELGDDGCYGNMSITMHVVPEYQKWIGKATDNWNNDENWVRSTKDELKKTDGAYIDYTDKPTDREHAGYVPMRFTNVIIPGAKDAEEAKKVELYNAIATGASHPILNLSTIGKETAVTGEATANIEYDLMVKNTLNEAGNAYECEPYYTNLVDQIHFEPKAEMLHAELLTYKKAWVDYKLASGQWYTLASPLQGVVAGDFYTDNDGVEDSEYFKGIEFDEDENSRISPSVYQRAWKDANAKMVGVGEGDDGERAIAGNWSAVYNKVDEAYTPGTGFSVKVLNTKDNGNAIFRLPKADKSYDYYTVDENGDISVSTSVKPAQIVETTAERSYLLKSTELRNAGSFTVDLVKNNESDYYLIGNPFMAHLNMKKFFESNPAFAKTYWSVTENSQSVGIGEEIKTPIAPLQSFFVKLKDGEMAPSTVTFTADMQVLGGTSTGEGETTGQALMITATNSEGKTSRAAVAYDAMASDDYRAAEDAELFLDSNLGDVPMVYTVAGTMATSINTRTACERVPLGVYGAADEEVTLRFDGTGLFSGVKLYDAKTRAYTPLTDGREVRVRANDYGRYYLTGGLATDNDLIHTGDDIEIYSVRPGEIVVTTVGTPLRAVRVYGVDGDLVTQQTLANQTAYRLNVPRGAIYVVYAEDADGIIRNVKLRVR